MINPTIPKNITDSRNPFAGILKQFMLKQKTLFEVEYACKRTSITKLGFWFIPVDKKETNLLFLSNDIIRNEAAKDWLEKCKRFCKDDIEKQMLQKKIDDYNNCIELQKIWRSQAIADKKSGKKSAAI